MARLLSPRAQHALLDFLSWPADHYRRKLRVIVGILGLLGLIETRRRVVTRLLRALKRGVTAAIASYIEERGGMKLFTLDDDISAPLPEPLHPGQQLPLSPESVSPTQTEPTSPDTAAGADSLQKAGSGLASSSAAAAASLIDRLLTSAKLFSCMDLDESRRLYARCPVVVLEPSQHLFSAGDPSDAGVFVVAGGRLGLYWEHHSHHHSKRSSTDAPTAAASAAELAVDPSLGGAAGGRSSGTFSSSNSASASPQGHLIATLGFGQSVGDVDMLDGMPRTLSCRAMGEGARLIQVSRELFLKTAAESPRVLQLFLQMSIARLWRVASFTLRDFLQLPLEHAAATARPLTEAQAVTLAEGALQQPGQRENIRSTAAATYFNGEASLSPPNSPKGVVRPPKTLSGILSGGQDAASPASAAAKVAAVRPSSPLAMLMQPLRGILRSSNWRSAAPEEPGTPKSLKSQRRVSFSDVNQLHRVSSGADLAAQPGQAPEEGGKSEGGATHAPVFPIKVQTSQASITNGWDVVSPDDSGIAAATLEMLKGGLEAGQRCSGAGDTFGSCPTMSVDPGEVLNEADESLRGFFILLEGCLLVERAVAGKRRTEMALVVPGSVVHGGAFLTGTKAHCRAWAADKERCLLAAVDQAELDALVARAERDEAAAAAAAAGEEEVQCGSDGDTSMHSAYEDEEGSDRPGSSMSLASMVSARSTLSEPPSKGLSPGAVVAELLLAAARALGPTIRQFISLGLSREWMRAGDVVYREGDPAAALYIVISGRARLLHSGGKGSRRIVVDDEVGRGASMGAVWTLSGGFHDTTCLCVRDVEAVRMSKASFEMIAASRPKAAARVLQGMAMRLAAAGASRRAASMSTSTTASGVTYSSSSSTTSAAFGGPVRAAAAVGGSAGTIATIAVLPAGQPLEGSTATAQDAVTKLARALRTTLESSYGPTLREN